MKTFSVKEVAEALDMTPRGVIQRLNRGQLKGNKKLNQFGVAEWQVYANREILMAAETRKSSTGSPINEQSFAPDADDTIDAEDIEVSGDYAPDGPTNWRDIEMQRLEVLAEKLVKPLAERLEAQAAELREKEKLLEEKERQLRLLPDLEKRAEEERKAAEIRALEIEALKKQISALEEVKQESESKLSALEEERRATEQAQLKVQELEKAMSELRETDEANRRAAEEELERIKAEKEAEAQAVRDQLNSLTSKLEELQKPWWKKWFLPREV